MASSAPKLAPQLPSHIVDMARRNHLRVGGHALSSVVAEPKWSCAELSGRLSEISGKTTSAVLTAAFELVCDAQAQGETTVWVTSQESVFFPPDAAQMGIDLSALVVVCVPSVMHIPRAGDKLARSGAFGLIVLDMQGAREPNLYQPAPRVPTPLLSRLLGLARKFDTAVVFLTEKNAEDESLGSLISLRGEPRRVLLKGQEKSSSIVSFAEEGIDVQMRLSLKVLKDKYRSPGWTHEEVCSGPAGLC